ncbi:hypothetical protein EAG_09347 [Camponotus floridanus]|uniref:Uncharacterized protein n=1 Tax=Camponotus floridanus TaxID=104421 RepID=E2ABH8_CAMFO|nr:hypothetical protein EAG_09347 [Camponotus floridanus]
MNSKAKSSSSTFFPSLQSANCQTFDRKDEFIRDEKIDPVEILPSMINKLSISESTKRDITSKLIQKATVQEDITEHNFKRIMTFSYDIDGMSPEELYASLNRITENPQQPFSFLANISNEIADNQSSIKTEKESTEIDIQLAAVAKRIELSKILLDKTKSYVEDIRLRAKQNIYPSLEINGCNSLLNYLVKLLWNELDGIHQWEYLQICCNQTSVTISKKTIVKNAKNM